MADVRPGSEFASWMSIQPSEFGQAIKTGLTAYGLQQSGLTDWLNSLSKKQTSIPGSVAPFTAISDQKQLPAIPQVPENMNWGSMASKAPVVPGATAPLTAPATTAPEMPTPKDIGMDWLNGKISNFVSPQASRDVLTVQQTIMPQMPANPAEWQNPSTGLGLSDKLKQFLPKMG